LKELSYFLVLYSLSVKLTIKHNGTSTVAAGSDADYNSNNKHEKLIMLLNDNSGSWLSESDKSAFLSRRFQKLIHS
jgi:hypothetical protein